MYNWKKKITISITIIGLIASIIGIFSFLTGKQNIYEVINNNSKNNYKKIENSEKNLTDGIYIESSPLRGLPSFFQSIFILLSPFLGGGNDEIYLVNGSKKDLFLSTDYLPSNSVGPKEEFPFSIRISPDNQRFIVNFYNLFHISNIDGSHHNSFNIKGGYIENIAFSSNNKFTIYIFQDYYKTNIEIAQFTLEFPGLYEVRLDKQNNIRSINKLSEIEKKL